MKSSKYHAKGQRTPDGYFHSQGEYRRWCDLKLLQRAGKIAKLERGHRYPLEINGIVVGHYRPDYEYRENGLILEDFHPLHTEASRLRIAVFEALYHVKVRLTGQRAKRGRAA